MKRNQYDVLLTSGTMMYTKVRAKNTRVFFSDLA